MTEKEFKKLRAAGGWTLKALAAELGVDWVTVWRWENGKTSVPDMAARLTQILLEAKRKPKKEKRP